MMPMDNNMPLVQGEEDCGCGGESRLYSPQPGGAICESFILPTNSVCICTTARNDVLSTDPPNVFGEPVSEEEDEEEV